jgi:hypothetical protein
VTTTKKVPDLTTVPEPITTEQPPLTTDRLPETTEQPPAPVTTPEVGKEDTDSDWSDLVPMV